MTSSLSSPGLSWLPLMGFDFAGLVVWLLLAPRSWWPPGRSPCFLASSRSGVLCDASWGPPLFPRSLRRSLVSCLAALPFASLPLVSRPWTVLSWSHLTSLSSVSGHFVVVPRQLVGLGGCSPASPNCPPFRVGKQHSFGFSASLSLQVFAMSHPSGSSRSQSSNITTALTTTSWCLVGAFAMRSPLRAEFFSDLDWNEDTLSIFPRVSCLAFAMGSPVPGRVWFSSHSIETKSSLDSWSVFLQDGVTLFGSRFYRSDLD